MATSLGKVGIVDRGNYLQEEIYNAGDFVLYNGSTWLALKDGLLGAEPAEGTSWKYLARGFEAEVLSMIAANDTSGLMGEEGQQVNAQILLDMIADKVTTKLIEKGMIANNLVTDNENMVLAAPMGKKLQEQLSDVNKNINGTFYETGDLIEWANSKHETMLGSFSSACINLPSTGNFDVIRFEHGGYLASMIAIRQFDRKMFVSEYNTVAWSDWTEYVTNSDFKRTVEIRLPYIALNGKLYASYAFPVRLDSIPNVTLDDYSIDGIGQVDSFRNYLVNQEEVIFEFTKSDMNFELGKCYIGRTKFTIS